jgi:hypothetical protein
MYPMTIGGSAILHLLAAHPRVVAVFGIAAAVAMLTTPLGRGEYPGERKYAAAIERAVSSNPAASPVALRRADERATMLSQMSSDRLRQVLRETLHACGDRCVDETNGPIASDPERLKTILFLHELDPRLSGDTGKTATVTVARRETKGSHANRPGQPIGPQQ